MILEPFQFFTRIAYGDVDENLSLSLHGAMRMMQEAAIIHSDKIGYSVYDAERTRMIWLLAQWRVRLLGSARWNEPVTVLTWPQTMERATSNRCFQIKNARGDIIAVGESVWILVSVDTGRVIRIPAEVAAAYELNPAGVFASPTPKIPKTLGEKTYTGQVLRRDIDTNHHVNNLVYLDYALEAMPEAAAETAFAEVIVHYHRQMLYADPICCYYQPMEQGHLVQICGEDPVQLHCTVLFRP